MHSSTLAAKRMRNRRTAADASVFEALRSTLRSAPTPDRLPERPAANRQVLTATAVQEAWQHGAVHL